MLYLRAGLLSDGRAVSQISEVRAAPGDRLGRPPCRNQPVTACGNKNPLQFGRINC